MSKIPIRSRTASTFGESLDDRPHSPVASLAFPSSASSPSVDPSSPPHPSRPRRPPAVSLTSQPNDMSAYRGSPLHSGRSDHGSDLGLSETRKRQSKRDEAIRKKIENELARKRNTGGASSGHGSGSKRTRKTSRTAAGTVSALRPLPALTVPSHISVADASQLCAAKRTDCVLVVDEDEHLCGIFTAKDLAFRVVAQGLDARSTPVSAIMTRNPMVTRDTTSATDALNTMVTRGFRHLPVCNEEGDVVGLLDIAKVFYEALEKLERAHGSSQKLYNALEGVQTEWGTGAVGGPQAAMMQYIDALREKMSIPDLTTILDSRTLPATVGVRTTVKDAAKLMAEHHTTAVCVMESGPVGGPPGGGQIPSGKIAGIFTSKDVVLRVIAAGLDPRTCSVVRVMTPHPDVAEPSLTIQAALRKMHDGHYLNLPVVDSERLVGVVDVLKLTYATLEQINSMGSESGDAGSGGPMWNRFWNSFGQGSAVDGADTESALSGHTGAHDAPVESPLRPGRDLHDFPIGVSSPASEVHPNDSASVVGDDHSNVGGFLGASGAASGVAGSIGGGTGMGTGIGVPIDDGTYLFKFVTPSGRTHRFSARYDNFENIREIVAIKLVGDPFFAEASAAATAGPGATGVPPTPPASDLDAPTAPPPSTAALPATGPDPNDFQLAYTDDDGDMVLITADDDVRDAVKVARAQGKDRVILYVQGGKGWEAEKARTGEMHAKSLKAAKEAALKSVAEEEEEEGEEGEGSGKRGKDKGGAKEDVVDQELVFGVIPKDLLLPASIGFLGVVIIGVFAVSRITGGGGGRY